MSRQTVQSVVQLAFNEKTKTARLVISNVQVAKNLLTKGFTVGTEIGLFQVTNTESNEISVLITPTHSFDKGNAPEYIGEVTSATSYRVVMKFTEVTPETYALLKTFTNSDNEITNFYVHTNRPILSLYSM